MAWFQSLRALVYLKRISNSLERIALFTDSQLPNMPKRSRRVENPAGEIFRPTVKEWNADWRERNADILADGKVEEEP